MNMPVRPSTGSVNDGRSSLEPDGNSLETQFRHGGVDDRRLRDLKHRLPVHSGGPDPGKKATFQPAEFPHTRLRLGQTRRQIVHLRL
jgi:hypothetical protein